MSRVPHASLFSSKRWAPTIVTTPALTDTGTLTATINGVPASYTWGPNDSLSSVWNGLINNINAKDGGFLHATQSSTNPGTINLTSLQTSSATNWPVSLTISSSLGPQQSGFGATALSMTGGVAGEAGATASGNYTTMVYSPGGSKLGNLQNGTLLAAEIPLPGGGTAMYNGSGLNYFRHADWLGSSRLATTWNHTIYSKTAYAPFGETYNQAGTTDASFTGEDTDTSSGAYNFLFRKLDPVAGRWLSPDPSGLAYANLTNPQSLNLYAYLRNNPLTNVDPAGLDCVSYGPGGAENIYSGDCPGTDPNNEYYVDCGDDNDDGCLSDIVSAYLRQGSTGQYDHLSLMANGNGAFFDAEIAHFDYTSSNWGGADASVGTGVSSFTPNFPVLETPTTPFASANHIAADNLRQIAQTACKAAAVAAGAGAGALIGSPAGGVVGGVVGAAAGGAGGTLVEPGGGTLVGGYAGGAAGASAGSTAGAWLGGLIGGGIGYVVGNVACSSSIGGGGDYQANQSHCDAQLEADLNVCRTAKSRACYAQAYVRHDVCSRGLPVPPLNF